MKRSAKLLKFFLWSGFASFSGLLLVAASAFLYLSPSLPAVDSLRDTNLQTPLRIYSKDELLIAEFGEKRRTPVHFDDTPEKMVKAFMAAEDDRFYYHPGVDIVGLLRAAVQLVSTGRIQSGGSTITMQVAKNFFLSHERVFSRKFNEILLALQIEQELTKNEIFELYLNKIYLGNRAYGVEAAAQVYYGKSIDELSLAQQAMIAGLPKAPSRYNPINDPDRALIRRNWILGRMQELGYIRDDEYQEAVNEPTTASYHGTPIELQAPYIAEMVRQEMVERFGPETYTEGFRVFTTVDSTLQKAANESVANGLFAYTEKHGYKGPIRNLNEENEISDEDESFAVWQKALKKARSAGPLKPAVVTLVEDQSATILMKQSKVTTLDWDNIEWAKKYINVNAFGHNPKTATDVLKVGDLIWVRQMEDGRFRLAEEPEAQSSLISMNPESGAILALLGGFNFYDSMYNRSTQAVRQAGSSFKPFVYASALDDGLTAASIINDAPVVFDDEGLEGTWRPNNDNMKFNGPMRLREGLYRSRNLISIRILREVGISKAVSFMARLGLPAEAITQNLSLALGNVAMTPLEMTTGYATIANGGYKVSPYLINRVEVLDETVFKSSPATVCRECLNKKLNEDTENSEKLTTEAITTPDATDLPEEVIVAETVTPAELVMDPRVNYIINDIMRDVIWKGTGKRARALERHDIGGKTGTTNDSKDVWFIGFNPKVLTSVWVGMDNNTTLGRWEYGGNTALPIWLSYMKVALDGMPEQRLPQPDGIETVKIDPETGQLANQGNPNAIFELFRKENTPKAVSQPKTNGEDGTPAFKPEDLF
ncbi:peptidase [Endozoicomonas sp. OPT23]|uniref:penicillin-binding protein 1A n=1 Tax=Endozoicomonas sp. OPT23 TaxID=2072845 RepID=UPI00129AA019|nr:penicillin-binding protein 1A [Endozoicomonas sp. OPT23]MRI32131.1 peptidase [Endozoicomonas sp. OPT23]